MKNAKTTAERSSEYRKRLVAKNRVTMTIDVSIFTHDLIMSEAGKSGIRCGEVVDQYIKRR